ncbi:hypothetical protein Sjap_002940 [Stephania japonica]|uniref:Uncharacterized protein n=1 Tax=Stephania japonica TaxID=461633 RepID=A0AAP0KQF6_9MAGN
MEVLRRPAKGPPSFGQPSWGGGMVKTTPFPLLLAIREGAKMEGLLMGSSPSCRHLVGPLCWLHYLWGGNNGDDLAASPPLAARFDAADAHVNAIDPLVSKSSINNKEIKDGSEVVPLLSLNSPLALALLLSTDSSSPEQAARWANLASVLCVSKPKFQKEF